MGGVKVGVYTQVEYIGGVGVYIYIGGVQVGVYSWSTGRSIYIGK